MQDASERAAALEDTNRRAARINHLLDEAERPSRSAQERQKLLHEAWLYALFAPTQTPALYAACARLEPLEIAAQERAGASP